MAATMKKMSVLVAALGILSFVFGILAEIKKPAAGVPIIGRGVIICKYPSDPTLAFAWLSFGFLVACSAVGWFSVFYGYKGRKAPTSAFLQSSTFVSFFTINLGAIGLAAAFLLWPIMTHHHLKKYNITGNQNPSSATCPTAKTGVLGGGAFMSLNSSLLWLSCFILASNVRDDYFEDLDGVKKPTHIEEAEDGRTAALEDDDSNEITSSSQ